MEWRTANARRELTGDADSALLEMLVDSDTVTVPIGSEVQSAQNVFLAVFSNNCDKFEIENRQVSPHCVTLNN